MCSSTVTAQTRKERMPVIPDFLGGPNGLLGMTAVLILLVAFFWKPVRAGMKLLKSIFLFIEDWNGSPERRDHAGAIIEKGRPGVPALLETVRSQVQNSHRTNFRDDLDTNTEETRRIGIEVRRLAEQLDEHIQIAIKSDVAQDQTAGKVERLVEDVGKLKSKYAPDS